MAPALFAGRDGEVAWIHTALKRGAAAVVVGPAGAGKTALALRALADAGDACVYVRAGPGGPGALGARLSAALAAIDAHIVDDTIDATMAVAERCGVTVVVEDAHRYPTGELRALLDAVWSHCARSRWLVLTRSDPLTTEMPGQTLSLGPMTATELALLARAAVADLTDAEIDALVDRAGGSPAGLWRAVDRRLLADRAPDPNLLDTLPALAAAFLRALDVFAIPVHAAVVAHVAAVPAPDVIDLLVDRGLIESTRAGFALTDEARVAGAAGSDGWRALPQLSAVAAALAATGDLDAKLEAIRLLLACGDDEGARALVETTGDALVASGRARGLHEVLAECEDEVSNRWKLRCAVTTGDPQALARARCPREPDLHDRHLWARALRLRGDLVGAAEAAAALEASARAAGDAHLTFEAGLLRARALAAHAERAVDVLAALDPPDERAAVRRDARLAVIESRAGDTQQALAMVDALRGRLTELDRHTRAEVAGWLASIVGRVGRIDEAERIVDRALALADPHDAATLELLYLSSGLALKRAAYDRAERIVSQLQRMGEGTSTRLRHHVATLAGFRAIAHGEYAGLEEKLSEEAYAAAEEDLPVVYGRLAALVFFVRTNTAAPLTSATPPDHEVLAGHPFGELLRVRRLVRLGQLDPETPPPHPDRYRNLEARVVAGLVAAEMGVVAGEHTRALALLAAALDTAQRYGYESWEFAIRQLTCEALLVMGDVERAAQHGRELVALGERARSRYHQLEARMLHMACTSRAPIPATLEELADAIDCAPMASRRARILLGGEARSDRLDDLVIAALRRLPGWADLSVVGSSPPDRSTGPWNTGWGLDELREQVWLPSGRTVDFSRWPVLWALLRALAEHGDSATKEYLVRTVWSESDYHPLRHDNRLQAAVRKLRHVIEDDASRPERIVTTTTGYRLGGVARRLRQARS